jgi:hypothetical protein
VTITRIGETANRPAPDLIDQDDSQGSEAIRTDSAD